MTLPDGVRLLHIGPHKTGTTTIQAAFHQNRDALAAQGVSYPGRNAHPMLAAMAAASGNALATSSLDAGTERWRELLDEVHASRARATVVSSEFFADAPAHRIGPILDDLGRDRVHVVVTLRPVIRILASQWQQFMQNRPALKHGGDLAYEEWLDQILNHADDTAVTPSFWKRHRHDRLIRTWAETVGADRMTVIVVDESDRRMLPRAFEEMLGLAEGTLEPRELSANRSLTYPEVQMLRSFNEQFVARGWSTADYTKFLRFGAIRHLQERRPHPDEPRLLTPSWAIERGAEIGASMVEEIAATGVRIVGDLDLLGDPAVASGVGANPTDVDIPTDVVARFAAGLVKVVAELPGRDAPPGRGIGELEMRVRHDKALRRAARDLPRIEQRIARTEAELAAVRQVADLTRPQLLRVVAGRVRRRLRRGVRA